MSNLMRSNRINMNDLDVRFLSSRSEIYEASSLLYTTCIDVAYPWKFASDNPSQLHVESRNGRHVLVDKFTELAEWLGVFHDEKLVACGRLISTENSPDGKLESELYSGSQIIDVSNVNCVEMNRVTVAREYQGSAIHNLLILSALDYCRLTQKNWLGCTSHPCIRKLFQKIEFKPLLARAFKYADTDPEPVDVYFSGSQELNRLCRKLRTTLTSSTNILEALELVANIVPTPLYWHDTEGRVIGLNDACLKGMGAPDRTAIIGKTPYDFYPEDTANLIWLHSAEVMSKDQIMSQDEPINQISTGEYFYAKSIKAPLHDANGNVIGVLGSSIDITAEKLSEQLKILNETQRVALAEKEKYVAIARNVAHDIASPLTTLSILSKAFKRIPEARRIAFDSALTRLSTIAKDLLTTYRLAENGFPINDGIEQRQTVCIYEHIGQIVDEKKIQCSAITFELIAQPVAKTAIAILQVSQFQRALSNLLNNAVDAMGDAIGTITVCLEVNQQQIILKVKDAGKGMSAAVREKILDGQRVTDAKQNGNGMGMQQVWELLKRNQGVIQIHSELGVGTEVVLMFPRC